MNRDAESAVDVDADGENGSMPHSERTPARGPRTRSTPPEGVTMTSPPAIPGSPLDAIERYAILKTLESVGWSTSRAAVIFGISVRKVQYRLHEYGETRSES